MYQQRKPSNEIIYIQKESNHPPSALRQILLSIESCLSENPPNEKIFKVSTKNHQEALKNRLFKITD